MVRWHPRTEVCKTIAENGIKGLRFVIDGKPECPKEVLDIHLKKHGAILCDNVTKKTDYLILTAPGDSGTKKAEKAKEYGIPTMNEPSFNYFIGRRFSDQEVVTVPDWLKIIADNAFDGCRSMKEVILPETIEEIGAGAFYNCTSLSVIKMPSSVKRIKWAAFSNCASLRDFEFPHRDDLWIGAGLFMGCKSLQRINLPKSLESINGYFFKGCESLREIILPLNVTEIQTEAFRTCTKLRTVIVPKGVTWIQTYAFSGCRNLRDIYLPDTVNSIQYDVFRGCPKLTIHAPAGSYAEEYAKKNGINVVND